MSFYLKDTSSIVRHRSTRFNLIKGLNPAVNVHNLWTNKVKYFTYATLQSAALALAGGILN